MPEVDNTSILNTVKASLGLASDYTPFDAEIIRDVNAVLNIVNQLGVGEQDFQIVDNTATWDDFLGDEDLNFNTVKTYVAQRTRILFDPPTSGILMDATNKIISELEWRILVDKETPHEETT